jgi:hypothetical protein
MLRGSSKRQNLEVAASTKRKEAGGLQCLAYKI